MPDWFAIGIPQGNHLSHPSNLLTDYLKQTGIMEPLKTDYESAYVDQNIFETDD